MAKAVWGKTSSGVLPNRTAVEAFVRPQPGGQVSVGARIIKLPLFPELNYWFPPQLIAALATIAQLAHDCRDSHYRNVALTSLSASIVAKWPNTLSYAMDIDHTRPHHQVQRFRLDQILRVPHKARPHDCVPWITL